MKVEIQEADGDMKTFRFPLWILPTGLMSKLIVKSQSKELATGKEYCRNPANFLTGDDKKIAAFLKVVKQFAKENPDWVLVECEEENGDKVKVSF